MFIHICKGGLRLIFCLWRCILGQASPLLAGKQHVRPEIVAAFNEDLLLLHVF